MKSSVERLPYALRLFLLQSLIWTGLCAGTELVCRLLLHRGYPYNYPAVPASALFGDFRSYIGKFAFFHSRAFFQTAPALTYPAPSVVFFKPFLLPQPRTRAQLHWAVIRFIAAILLTSLGMLLAFRRAILGRGLAPRLANLFLLGTFACSFAFWFEVHQGNIEFVVWIVLVVAIAAIWTGRFWTAAIFLGLAIAMKLYPVILLGIPIAQKRYREAAVALLVAGTVTVASLWLVCPDIGYSWHATNAAIDTIRPFYMLDLRPIESGFDHGLFVLLKRLLPRLPPSPQLSVLLKAYLGSAALGGSVLFVWRIRRLPVVNQILALSILAILLPPVSYDYTLIHLYAPLALLTFVALHDAQGRSRALVFAFSLLAFILSPQSEFIVHGLRVAGQLKAVALLALLVISLVSPFTIEANTVSESAFAGQPLKRVRA